MTRCFRVGLGVLALFAPFVAAQTPDIDHQPVACAVAERFPKLEARFVPADGVAKARVVFQGANASEWYSVDMKSERSNFSGILPKPQKGLKSFRYYIEVTDQALGTNRTVDYEAIVVGSSGECQGKLTAAALGSASILLQGPAGVAALPAGFAANGVVVAGASAGSSSAAGAAGASSAGAGGGVGATGLVLGGIAVAGGAAAAVVAKGGGGDGESSSSSSTGSGGANRSVYSMLFLPSPPGIDMSVCVGRPLTWSSQALSVEANGTFNDTWAPNEPNTARVAGNLTATAFQAMITCTNGARSGTISASGSNNTYSGTFAFGSSTGQVSVTKQ